MANKPEVDIPNLFHAKTDGTRAELDAYSHDQSAIAFELLALHATNVSQAIETVHGYFPRSRPRDPNKYRAYTFQESEGLYSVYDLMLFDLELYYSRLDRVETAMKGNVSDGLRRSRMDCVSEVKLLNGRIREMWDVLSNEAVSAKERRVTRDRTVNSLPSVANRWAILARWISQIGRAMPGMTG